MSTNSSQCQNNPILVPLRKPPDPVNYLYYGHTYDLKTRVDIWTRMDVVPVEYGTFAQTFHLTMWFFQFILWDYLQVGLCVVVYYRSDGVDWSLDQI